MNHQTYSAGLRRALSVLLLLATAAGCSVRSNVLSERDPSDPQAPIRDSNPYRPLLGGKEVEEKHLPAVDSQHEQAHPAPVSGPATHSHLDDSPSESQLGVVYVCPMHPEVNGSKGESCSRCGMVLVPTEEPMT